MAVHPVWYEWIAWRTRGTVRGVRDGRRKGSWRPSRTRWISVRLFKTVQAGGADLTLLAYVRRLQAGICHKAGYGQTQKCCFDWGHILFWSHLWMNFVKIIKSGYRYGGNGICTQKLLFLILSHGNHGNHRNLSSYMMTVIYKLKT